MTSDNLKGKVALVTGANVFGVFAVTKAMLLLVKKAEAGRIVNMSFTLINAVSRKQEGQGR